MRRIVQFSLFGLAAGLSACSTPDLVHPTEVLPYAGVRFINAVPDTAGAFGLDFRFVDLLESNAHYRITFRNTPTANKAPATDYATAIQFKGAREGNRHFKIFLDDTLQNLASSYFEDTTVAIVKGHNYTSMLWGNSRSTGTSAGLGGSKMAMTFWEDSATVNAGKVKMRFINTTGSAVDVYAFAGATAPVTPTWAAVPGYSKTTYVEVDTGAYTYRVRVAGTATALTGVGDMTAAAGATPTCDSKACGVGQFPDIEGIPGTRLSGSAISGILFPPSVSPSRAAVFANAGMAFMWDVRPARTCDPYC